MKAICIDGFALNKCDDNGFIIENEYSVVNDDSIWDIEQDDYRFIGGELRLTNTDAEWIEISEESFYKNFKIIKANEHELKILPEYFEAVKSGDKTFEVRKNDRCFGIDDILILREYSGTRYTGRQLYKRITYVLSGGQYGIEKDYVVLGIK